MRRWMVWTLAGIGLGLGAAVAIRSAMATPQPPYTSTYRQGAFELRDYPALVVAEVQVRGNHEQAGNAGFRLLANYIFGSNSRRQKIAMTAPVAQARSESEKLAMTAPVAQAPAGDGWTVRFFMPESRTLEDLPVPNDRRVTLTTLPPRRVAVVRFSGLVDAGDIARHTAALEAFIAGQGLSAVGPPTLQRYDPPWTPWFMRRNEIAIDVATVSPATQAGQ